jgi:hypothetical protein
MLDGPWKEGYVHPPNVHNRLHASGCQEYLAGAPLKALGRRHEVARNLIRFGVAKYQAGEFEPDFVPMHGFYGGLRSTPSPERRDHQSISRFPDGMSAYAGIITRASHPPQMRAVVEGRTFPSPWGNEHAERPRSVFELMPSY